MKRGWDTWVRYVPVAKRKKMAQKELKGLQKKGRSLRPVVVEGRAISETFWGKAWCQNLERYSDFHNRLPRGRAYLRNGSVLDLQIAPGEVQALVCGTKIYKVKVKVTPLSKARWEAICRDCSGAIDSLVELLQGRFSKAVMERLCQEKTGLFPSPSEIRFSCSCPDWAYMCKHVAAVLYGIGARLDHEPELLFRLREVDEKELIVQAGRELPLSPRQPEADRVLREEDLSGLFGLEIVSVEQSHPAVEVEAVSKGRKAPSGPEKEDKSAPSLGSGLAAKLSRARAANSGRPPRKGSGKASVAKSKKRKA